MTTKPVETQAPSDGDAGKGAPALDTPPQWIAAILADEAKRTEFENYAVGLSQKHFDAHKAAEEKRSRSMAGQVAAAQAWQALSEDQRGEWLADRDDREKAVVEAVEAGVPATLLEDRATASGVRQFHARFKATQPKTAPGQAEGGGDLRAIVQEELKKALTQGDKPGGSSATEMLAGTQGRGAGGGTVEQYKEGLRSGKKLPSPAEIDRMTARFAQ